MRKLSKFFSEKMIGITFAVALLLITLATVLSGCVDSLQNAGNEKNVSENLNVENVGKEENVSNNITSEKLSSAIIMSELGIVDDDDRWLCNKLPEKPHYDENLGFTISGAVSCLGESGEQITGSDIYVSSSGNDRNSGDSPSSALATLSEALCRVRPGQTIHILPGVYYGASAVAMLGKPGSDEVVIRGDGKKPEDVVLDGEYWRSSAITLGETYNVRIESLTVQHYIDAGIQTQLGANITIHNVISKENGRCSVMESSEGEGFGINFVGTKNITLSSSTFQNNGPLLANILTGEVLGTGINTFEVSGVISDNIIRKTRGGAILVEKGSNVVVEKNLAEHNYLLALNNYWDAGIWIDESVDVVVRNNTFHDNWGGAGITVSDEEKAYPERSKLITITGNNISGHFAGIHIWGYGVCPPPADVITNFEDLVRDNRLMNNTYLSRDYSVRCDPEFFGGEIPE